MHLNVNVGATWVSSECLGEKRGNVNSSISWEIDDDLDWLASVACRRYGDAVQRSQCLQMHAQVSLFARSHRACENHLCEALRRHAERSLKVVGNRCELAALTVGADECSGILLDLHAAVHKGVSQLGGCGIKRGERAPQIRRGRDAGNSSFSLLCFFDLFIDEPALSILGLDAHIAKGEFESEINELPGRAKEQWEERV